MKSYEEMLKEAEEKFPRNSENRERLEIPKPKCMIQGNQTIITNFTDITDIMRRDPKHLAKFLFRELAIPGHIEGKRLILQGRAQENLVEKKLEVYIKEFLYCKECNRPDTKIVKEGRLTFLVCEACGSKRSIKNI
ncbi:MAG: translation initiation factor IF-2 subunit beta [Candidatus Aenigmatarchaeota archaeon]